MDTKVSSMDCPVCGFFLGYLPWDGDSSSHEICPSCGLQFGYDDAGPGGPEARLSTYAEWRQRWIANGMIWSSVGQRPPSGWNPTAQLKRVETGAADRG